MSAPGIVIVGCGAGKRAEPCDAGEMYTGPYFRSCLAAALDLAPFGRVLILSARYGLLGLYDPIEPYDLTIGQPGAVTAARVATQADERGITGLPVTALCSARYAAVLAQVWADVATPLAGLGIGRQRHALALMRSEAAR